MTRSIDLARGVLLRFGVGDSVVVRLTDTTGSPDPAADRAHDGQRAIVVEGITKAQADGYKVRFADGYEAYIYEHEAVEA
jgi:hypothetical protein